MRSTIALVALVALAACGNYPAAVAGAGAGGSGSGGSGSGGEGGTGVGGAGGTGVGGSGGGQGGEACAGFRPGGYGTCEMLIGWIWEPSVGQCVNISGCGCPQDVACPELFQDEFACEATCGSPPRGPCNDVRGWPFSCPGDSGAGAPMPDPAAQELWVFTGQTCEPIYVCGCDPATAPCESVYDSFDACLGACLDVRPRCADYAAPDGCLADGACRWLAPGCGEPPVERPGCYPAQDCASDAECPPELTCQVRWTDPCVFDFCDACGMEVRICAPPQPVGCEGTARDDGGTCRAPDGSLAPIECCAPYDCDISHGTCRAMLPACPEGTVATVNATGCWGPCVPVDLCAGGGISFEEQLCNDTAGRWAPDACGHAWCGMPTDCQAIIPGCDCGPGRNFDPRRGCFEDPNCSPPDDIALCQQTGGAWDPNSCGHWSCGQPPLCNAIIPGCNCGPDMNFQPGLGCVRDAACAVTGCDQNHPCPDGQLCVQPDPFFTGECRPLGEVCRSDADCAAGTLCCYPCGMPGCTNSCIPPGADGNCPMFP